MNKRLLAVHGDAKNCYYLPFKMGLLTAKILSWKIKILTWNKINVQLVGKLELFRKIIEELKYTKKNRMCNYLDS